MKPKKQTNLFFLVPNDRNPKLISSIAVNSLWDLRVMTSNLNKWGAEMCYRLSPQRSDSIYLYTLRHFSPWSKRPDGGNRGRGGCKYLMFLTMNKSNLQLLKLWSVLLLVFLFFGLWEVIFRICRFGWYAYSGEICVELVRRFIGMLKME